MKHIKAGIIGGGQLGKALIEAALPLRFNVAIIDPGINCPAAQAGAKQMRANFVDTSAIDEFVAQVSAHYIGLYQRIFGHTFEAASEESEAAQLDRIRANLTDFLEKPSIAEETSWLRSYQ